MALRIALLAPVRRGRAHGGVVALEVHPDNLVPVRLGQVEDHPVAQDAGHVDDNVQLAELVDGGPDEPFPGRDVANVAAVRHGRASGRDDLVRDLLSRALVAAGAVRAAAEIVDDQRGSLASEQPADRGSDAAGAARDDRYPAVDDAHPSSDYDRVSRVPPADQ